MKFQRLQLSAAPPFRLSTSLTLHHKRACANTAQKKHHGVPATNFRWASVNSDQKAVPRPSKYRYSSLPDLGHIRIIHLLPGTGKDELKCSLIVQSLTKARKNYEAISYVWGDQTVTENIMCDGKKIPITVNLADALRAFRHPSKSRALWADAICINQKDELEKGHQVQKMGQVYEFARTVRVWLGEDVHGIAQDCFELMRETCQYLNEQSNRYGGWFRFPTLKAPCAVCSDTARWDKVSQLFALPWFDRIWVIQEAGLAKSCVLLWGKQEIHMFEIVEMAIWMAYRPDLANMAGVMRSTKVKQIFQSVQCTYAGSRSWRSKTAMLMNIQNHVLKESNATFTSILNAGRSTTATDKRDHIYAFLGHPLARRTDGQLIVEPNYSRLRKTAAVYFDTACALLRHPREAQWVLASVQHKAPTDVEGLSVPSWVPRWDRGPMYSGIAHPLYWYRAGGPLNNFYKEVHVKGEKALELTGFIFDTLHWTSKPLRSANFELNDDLWDSDMHAARKPYIDQLWDKVQANAGQGVANLSYNFSLTLSQGKPTRKEGMFTASHHYLEFAAYCHAIRQVVNPTTVNAATRFPGAKEAEPYRFLKSVRYCHNLRLFLTNSKRLGLAPQMSKAGDVCCVIPGVSVPLVLRPKGEGRYNLVGAGYAQGVMKGELMEQLEEGQYKKEKMVLV